MKNLKHTTELKNAIYDFISSNGNLLRLSREELAIVRKAFDLENLIEKYSEK